ncbi:coA disulfide reductase [Jeotgalibacillus alimentarius]|uniref:CoA disulfide reductase n=1 Tax=Jeotgalibacillus alimentarius TaxID=135826 RepID=A0A0C2VRQ5_9BACL|nr:CoA-disulfide reductase [Jeotgalibacillus alimentarius]KIL46678.1 coA disulfide reductase [Jeotgalibacillus alimentarius]
MKCIVIGGIAAGMSAASKLRRMDPHAEITVYERGGYPTYGACGLPYFISGENDDHRKMIARTAEQFEAMDIHVKLKHEVVKVDAIKKQVMVRDLNTGSVFVDHFDKLMISTGTTAVVPPFAGLEAEGISVLKSMEDGLRIKEQLSAESVRTVTIVGGGYIGIEMAEALTTRGKKVRIVEMADRILTPFDQEMSDLAEQELLAKGVSLHLKEKLQSFGTEANHVASVITDRETYQTDYVLISVGVRPATAFLKDSGIHLSSNGAIITDREMRTNMPDIYAAGDCATVYHKLKKENDYLPLGTNANKCGRIVGANMAGLHEKYTGTLGSAAIKIFDLEMGRTGLSESEAKALKIETETVFIESKDHPQYYPDATPLYIKLICEKRTRTVLGAQAAGQKGAVLRIDALAIAIHNRMTADELGMVDLCYAPPFAGVWDAIHIAANAVK